MRVECNILYINDVCLYKIVTLFLVLQNARLQEAMLRCVVLFIRAEVSRRNPVRYVI